MIVAVMPVKRPSEAKSRLSVTLSRDQRVALARHLARQVVTALRRSEALGEVAVATPEPSLAEELGAAWIPDAGALNPTLAAAVAWAGRCGAAALLIVPADLPHLRSEDVRVLVDSRPARDGIVLAPTHDGGTGALLLAPPGAIPPAFGSASADRHLALARARGLAVRTVDRPAFRYDLDTVEDLQACVDGMRKGHTGGMTPIDVSLEVSR